MLVDKGRGPGGRMATRRIGESCFDHGAQFFTVRDLRFREAVERWEAAGLVAPWFTEGGHVRYYAKAGMNALAKYLASPLDVRSGVRVNRVEARNGGWQAIAESGEVFGADVLLLTPPAPQTRALLETCADRLPGGLLSALQAIEFHPCFALLVSTDGPARIPSPGYIRPENGPIEWIADNMQKGISSGSAALTIHARPEFSRSYIEADRAAVARLLFDASEPWLGGTILATQLHLWRYSKPVDHESPSQIFHHEPAPLAVAGDAFRGGRIEGAFLSGLSAAHRITSELT